MSKRKKQSQPLDGAALKRITARRTAANADRLQAVDLALITDDVVQERPHPAETSDKQYAEALTDFDTVLCEAIAVSQAQANRQSEWLVAYASKVFTRLCAHGTALIRAAPRSRWVTCDHEDWSFAGVAVHARALLEGYLLLCYLADPPGDEDESNARINLLHLNDCTRRIELFQNMRADESEVEGFQAQQSELRERLTSSSYFVTLHPAVQKSCLSGQKLHFKSREQLIELAGWEKADFLFLWDLYSQHSHILPLSFVRMEPNGRDTGIENDTDKGYIVVALRSAEEVLRKSTDQMVEFFPDVAWRRCGIYSTFSPGPSANTANTPDANPRTSDLSDSISKLIGEP